MADNYLERRMDDYRSGRLAPKSRKPSATSLPADALVLRYPALRILLRADALTPELVSLVKAMRRVGLRVAVWCGEDASALCMREGARCYPSRMDARQVLADLDARWGGTDRAVVIGDATLPVPSLRACFPEGADTDVVARAILFALHPDNASLLDVQILGAGFLYSAENA